VLIYRVRQIEDLRQHQQKDTVLFAAYTLTLGHRDALAPVKASLLSCCREEVEWFPWRLMIVNIARLSLWPHRSLRLPLSIKACRLPEGIDSPRRLWQTLLRNDNLVIENSPNRWDADEYYDPNQGAGCGAWHGR
jgi:hypothetical protein